MTPQNETQIMEDFPELFAGFSKDGGKKCCAFGIACNDGWYNLIYGLCRVIDHRVKSKQTEEVLILQIKEKFGTLRFHTTSTDPYVLGLVAMTEYYSSMTCDECGDEAKVKSKNGWLRVQCEKCLDKE